MSPDRLTHPAIMRLAAESSRVQLAVAAAERLAGTLTQLQRDRDRCLTLAEGIRAAFAALPGVSIEHPDGPGLIQRECVRLAQADAYDQSIRDLDQLAASMEVSALIVVHKNMSFTVRYGSESGAMPPNTYAANRCNAVASARQRFTR